MSFWYGYQAPVSHPTDLPLREARNISTPLNRGELLRGATIITVICTGLWIDQIFLAHGQLMVNVAVWLLFVAWLWREHERARSALVACLVYATIGEIFLSLIWGLYDYRLANVPLFVPPGHVLLFMLGGLLAARAAKWIVWAVPVAAAPFVLFLAITGADTLGLALYSIFLACMALGRAKKLYAVMFMVALAMELYGTWLGNWTWSAAVPWLGLSALNPPLAAGAFYCVLDLLVVATVARMSRRAPAASTPPEYASTA
jgi:hypothetical protein